MQVYAWIKHKEHPEPNRKGASHRGDLVYFYPIVDDQGRLTQKTYFPVVVDINIPCGEKFNIGEDGNRMWNCGRCEHNAPALCDVRKYARAVWGPGTLFNVPKPIIKRRTKVDIDSLLSVGSKELVFKRDKTEVEKELVIQRAHNNPVAKTVFIDKVK